MPIFYSFRRCPYAMRARLALLVSGATVEIREVTLGNKPDELRTVSAKATVPVLIVDGDVIDESLDIMRWALDQADPEHWLAADDPMLVAACDGAFKRHLDGYKYGNSQSHETLAHRAAGLAFLQVLEARLAVTANLCSTAPGLADMAIMPFVRQFSGVEPAWFDALPLPAVQAWLARYLDTALFSAAMVRLPRWTAGDTPRAFGI